jgi:hypothetical protein
MWLETFYNTAIALQHIYLNEQYIFNESKRLYIVGIKFQFNHSMYVGIEAYTDTVILEDLHLYAYFIKLQHSSFNYIYLHFMI